jgi:hypothetical protein
MSNEGKVSPSDLKRIFGADKAEVTAQLDEKVPQFVEEGAVEIHFRMNLWQAEEFEVVSILEDAQGIGM